MTKEAKVSKCHWMEVVFIIIHPVLSRGFQSVALASQFKLNFHFCFASQSSQLLANNFSDRTHMHKRSYSGEVEEGRLSIWRQWRKFEFEWFRFLFVAHLAGNTKSNAHTHTLITTKHQPLLLELPTIYYSDTHKEN